MKISGYNFNTRKINKIRRRLKHLPTGIDFFKYSYNKLLFIYLKVIKSTKVAYPTSVVLEVTNHCNLACITCPREYDYGKNMDKGLMKRIGMFKIIDEVAPYVDSIGLTGLGEPLIDKKLQEAFIYIKEKNKGIQTSISTNAHIPMVDEHLEKIIPYLDQLQISIDGIGETYETVRKNASYNLFIENTKKLVSICKKNKVTTFFNFVIVKENYHQMEDILVLANELGIDYVNMNPINLASVTGHDVSYYDLFYSDNYIKKLNAAVKRSKTLPNITFSIYDYKSKNGFKKCYYPWLHFYVSWNGYISPCCAKPFPKELNFGNAFEKGLMNCLNSKEYRNFRKMWFKNIAPEFCLKCGVIDLKPIELEAKVDIF